MILGKGTVLPGVAEAAGAFAHDAIAPGGVFLLPAAGAAAQGVFCFFLATAV